MSAATKLSNAVNSEASIHEVSEQIKILQRDLAALTSTMGDYTAAKTAQVRDTAKEKASELASASRDKALETQMHAEEFVRTQPATALGIAAGVGFLVGMFTARR